MECICGGSKRKRKARIKLERVGSSIHLHPSSPCIFLCFFIGKLLTEKKEKIPHNRIKRESMWEILQWDEQWYKDDSKNRSADQLYGKDAHHFHYSCPFFPGRRWNLSKRVVESRKEHREYGAYFSLALETLKRFSSRVNVQGRFLSLHATIYLGIQ